MSGSFIDQFYTWCKVKVERSPLIVIWVSLGSQPTYWYQLLRLCLIINRYYLTPLYYGSLTTSPSYKTRLILCRYFQLSNYSRFLGSLFTSYSFLTTKFFVWSNTTVRLIPTFFRSTFLYPFYQVLHLFKKVLSVL